MSENLVCFSKSDKMIFDELLDIRGGGYLSWRRKRHRQYQLMNLKTVTSLAMRK